MSNDFCSAHSRESGNPETDAAFARVKWIPAFAGMSGGRD